LSMQREIIRYLILFRRPISDACTDKRRRRRRYLLGNYYNTLYIPDEIRETIYSL